MPLKYGLSNKYFLELTLYLLWGRRRTNFEQIFQETSPENICNKFNIFTVAGKNFTAVTAGKAEDYNSLTAGGFGFGLLLMKPSTRRILREDSYKLELIEKEQRYILSYFPGEFKKQTLFLGSKSGRESAKMKEVQLTSIQPPSGNISFKEAKPVIECKLTQITVGKPEDFYTQEAKDYANEAYKEANIYRKYVFREITSARLKEQIQCRIPAQV